MKFRIVIMILCVTACSLGAMAQDATTQPADDSAAPTSRPDSSTARREYRRASRRLERRPDAGTGTGSTASLPAIYDAVAARDIFVKGNQRPPPPAAAGGPGSSTPASGVYAPTANQLVLTGISLEDNQKVGFLEDEQAYTSTRVKIGDPIANGKVVSMTLDALDYKDASGRIIRVEVGFNLAGGDVWGVSTSTGGPSTQPVSGAPRGPGESMEDYLKRRRASELSH